jgi:hypothetical protein
VLSSFSTCYEAGFKYWLSELYAGEHLSVDGPDSTSVGTRDASQCPARMESPSMNHLLDPAERERFARYCREEASSYALMAEQVEKLGPQMKAVAVSQKRFAIAYSIVAQHLESVEEQTIES